MYYDFAVVVPAGTQESAPVETPLPLTYGIVHRVEIGFPPGPHGLVRVRVLAGGHQLLPTNPDGYFASDNNTIVASTYYEMLTPPFLLKAVATSRGTLYDHTISIRVGLLPPEQLEPMRETSNLLQRFLKLLGIGM